MNMTQFVYQLKSSRCSQYHLQTIYYCSFDWFSLIHEDLEFFNKRSIIGSLKELQKPRDSYDK